MRANQSTFCAFGRWSRLAERCTCMQMSDPHWQPLLRHARGLRCQICLLRCFGGRSRRGKGRAWCFHALARSTWAPISHCRASPLRNCPSQHSAPCIACDRHQDQQWCAGEGEGQRRWRVRARSRSCMHLCKHADIQQCAMLESQRGCMPLPLLPPPSPGTRLPHLLLTLRLGCARPPRCLSICLPSSAFHPLSPPLPISHPLDVDKVQTRKPQQGISTKHVHAAPPRGVCVCVCARARACVRARHRLLGSGVVKAQTMLGSGVVKAQTVLGSGVVKAQTMLGSGVVKAQTACVCACAPQAAGFRGGQQPGRYCVHVRDGHTQRCAGSAAHT